MQFGTVVAREALYSGQMSLPQGPRGVAVQQTFDGAAITDHKPASIAHDWVT